MADSQKDTRQKAAQARATALAKEKRRERMIRIIGGLVVLVVVGGIIGGAIYVSSQGSSSDAQPDSNAASPNGVNTTEYFWPVNTTADVPQVRIFEDFQCPFCKKLEETSGKALVAEAEAGKLKLEYQPGIFMDKNLQNQGSLTATAAWGCAIDAGKGVAFHEGVFAEQPAQEVPGQPGFTSQQMLDLGKTVGIDGAAYTTFESCVNANTYNGWAANSNAQFEKSGVASTPSIFVNGKELPSKNIDIYNPAVLLPAIYAAAKS